ncbi:MAG: S1 RNA-binding domain-containing protein [Candidatus Pacebacteria bacterium]|nr:S1 RNA-binding domain-containing protein [Candidatus Paceibacterota bacterium]
MNTKTELLDKTSDKPLIEALVEGPVISITKNAVYVNLGPSSTGIIYGREFMVARDIIKKVAVGDSIKAKVVDIENEDGYVELSLKEAKQALIWSEADKLIKAKTPIEVTVKDANKGGLIIEWQGIMGFLPASQLSAENYPRVADSDKDKIHTELKKLVGQKLNLTMISALPKEGKLIFSEKTGEDAGRGEMLIKYNVGDEVETTVAGIVDFGVFLKLEDRLEGLVHISEIDWGLVDDTRSRFKIGDKVKAKIIEIKDGKVSLSIKALRENPWKDFENSLKKGDIVQGVVIKYNKHGALVSIKEGVAGLIHNSSIGGEQRLREKLTLGKTYDFQVTLFEPKDQRMTLVFMDPDKKLEKVETNETKEVVEEKSEEVKTDAE